MRGTRWDNLVIALKEFSRERYNLLKTENIHDRLNLIGFDEKVVLVNGNIRCKNLDIVNDYERILESLKIRPTYNRTSFSPPL